MNINLHIERLVLEGLPVDQTQETLIHKTVEQQLTSLLANGDLHDALRRGGNVHRMQTAAIRIAPEAGPTHLGKQIAGTLFGGIAK
jgi:hypothetical protein